MSTSAALVTGANKGIGFEVVRQLSPKFEGTIYLTARNEQRGQAAEATLRNEGCFNVKFLQMDVCDKKSIEKARDLIKAEHGGLDILINNAGIYIGEQDAIRGATCDQSYEAVKKTVDTNFTGLLNTCKTFFPILRAHARVVNVSSTLGSLQNLPDKNLKKQLVSAELTVGGLEKIFNDYLKSAENGTALKDGYPDGFGPYTMSKIGITSLSRVQQRNFDQDTARPDIVVNAVCPGHVGTDINNNSGPKTVQEGADSLVYLALLSPNCDGESGKPRGEFVFERQVYNWAAEEMPK